jgi:hypothetical protein
MSFTLWTACACSLASWVSSATGSTSVGGVAVLGLGRRGGGGGGRGRPRRGGWWGWVWGRGGAGGGGGPPVRTENAGVWRLLLRAVAMAIVLFYGC